MVVQYGIESFPRYKAKYDSCWMLRFLLMESSKKASCFKCPWKDCRKDDSLESMFRRMVNAAKEREAT